MGSGAKAGMRVRCSGNGCAHGALRLLSLYVILDGLASSATILQTVFVPKHNRGSACFLSAQRCAAMGRAKADEFGARC